MRILPYTVIRTKQNKNNNLFNLPVLLHTIHTFANQLQTKNVNHSTLNFSASSNFHYQSLMLLVLLQNFFFGVNAQVLSIFDKSNGLYNGQLECITTTCEQQQVLLNLKTGQEDRNDKSKENKELRYKTVVMLLEMFYLSR